MRCSGCDHPVTDVKDSRPTLDGLSIRRRRKCPSCATRFTTVEIAVNESRGGAPLEGAGAARTTELVSLLAQLCPADAAMAIELVRRLAPPAPEISTAVHETRPTRAA